MAGVNPSASLSDWRFSLYRGAPAAIDRFLKVIDATLPPGWVRDSEHEQPNRRGTVRCYRFDQAGDPVMRVWLRGVTATRARGGAIQPLRPPPSGDAGRFEQLLAEFADGCVLPASRAAGVCCARPLFGPRSAVPFAAEMLFTRIADAADGVWPLPEQVRPLWDELITLCLAEQAAFDRGELSRWLADSGWGPEAVPALVEQFYSDSAQVAKWKTVFAP